MGTSFSAQTTEISLALQPSKIGEAGTFDGSALTWQKFLAQDVAMGPVQEMGSMSSQIGGPITTTGIFKQAVAAQGQFTIYSRLQSTLGFLLKGLLGAASTTLNVDADGVSATGLNTHIFRFNPSDQSAQPWMAFRQKLPGTTSTGESYYDAKVASGSFEVAGKGKVMSQFAFIGRNYVTETSPTFTYANSNFDLDESSADAGSGAIQFAGVKYPISGFSLQIGNQLSADQEAIIGQYTMDDLVTLARQGVMKVQVKWSDAALHRSVSNGSSAGTVFNALPFIQNTSGAVSAVDIKFKAPADVVSGHPYALTFRIGRSVWTEDGPIQLKGGTVLSQTYTVTIIEPAAGVDFLRVILENAVTSY